ncbi:Ribonuclease Z protein [Dioscorea alata]|uniref:Ribonuclease Z protein n=1 Tax=Dioscorea alata TaxID=55571 RepID=A0ACB7VHV3_DIOAL|nr:Ribonuclease Z protein [Dioscorea alata]
MRHRRPHVLNAGVKGEEKWLAEAIAGIQQNAFYMHRAVDSNNLGGDEDEGIGSHVAAFDLDFLQCFGSKGMGFNLSMDVFVDGPAIWLSNGVNTGNYVYKLSIRAACGLAWQPDRFIIQVLDDSTEPIVKERLGHVIAYYPTMNFHLLSRAEPWDLMADLKSHLQMLYTQALWYCDLFTKSHSFPRKRSSCTSGISIGGHVMRVIVPSLSVAFDIGRCPARAVHQDFLFITHAHLDHILVAKSVSVR